MELLINKQPQTSGGKPGFFSPEMDQPKTGTSPYGNKNGYPADEVSERIMTMTSKEHIRMQPLEEEEEMLQPQIQMRPLEEEEETIQMKSIDGETNLIPSLDNQLMSSKGNGLSLSSATNRFMSHSFGTDFSNVHIHTGNEAIQMNNQLGSRAFTHGSDIYFNRGAYRPDSSEGKHLLAHELTHVLQQDGTPGNNIQRKVGDGHDLTSPRFEKDTKLQDIYDGTGNLKKGEQNDSVRRVQHAIHDSGIRFNVYGVDGKFEKITEKKVKRFQRRHKIKGDPAGEVGDDTIEKLDQLFPKAPLPVAAKSAFSFPVMKKILCAWNEAMIKDLQNLYVHLVGKLEWADEKFNGTTWVPDPMPGAGETVGHTIFIATNDTNENVAKTLYHEYQHARAPYAYRSKSWTDEETRVYTMETNWAISRGLTPDPTLTKTDPKSGKTVTDPAKVSSTVTSYPGLDTASPGEVEAKVGRKKVRVRMPDNSVKVRKAKKGDTVPGRRKITKPHKRVRKREWKC